MRLFAIFYAFTPRSWFLKFSYYFEIFQNFLRKSHFFFCLLLNISSGRYLRPKFSNPVKMNPALKIFWFSGNFYWYEMKFPVSKIFLVFCVTLDNFLVFVGISYCQLEVIFFLFYQESNAVQSEKFALSWGILHILPVFSEIIVY